MRTWISIACLLLFTGAMALAQTERTPPGGDMLGSDRPVTRNDIRSMPTASPDANQRMTQSSGMTSGYQANPAFAGASGQESGVAQQSPGMTGMEGQTPATAGRRRAEQKNRQKRRTAMTKGHQAANHRQAASRNGRSQRKTGAAALTGLGPNTHRTAGTRRTHRMTQRKQSGQTGASGATSPQPPR